MPRKTTRNAQGGGTIRQRADGTWEARYTLGRDPGTGKQIQKSVYGKTQKEVQDHPRGILALEDWLRIAEEARNAGTLYLLLTGGEPLLRKDFFDIMAPAHEMGFNWGMTSNATLIDKQVAKDLKRVGMNTISVSIDGLEETHDAFRRTPGGYKLAMQGIENLLEVGGFQAVQVTTVVTHENIGQLDELYKIFNEMDIETSAKI